MTWRNTWWLVGLAVALLAFILFYERHTGPAKPPVLAPARLLPRLNATEVTAVQVRRTNQFVVRAERVHEAWRLVAPLAYPASPVPVDRFLTVLERLDVTTRLTPKEVAHRKQTPADFGLDTPWVVIVIEQGDQRHELQLGALTTTGDQIYAQVVGQAGIDVVDARLLGLLPASINEWRNLALLDLPGGEYDRVEVLASGGGMFLQRDATNKVWQLSRGRQRADQLKVEALLEKIQQARVVDFVSDDTKADLEPLGLQPPQLELVLLRGTNEVQRIQFGKSPSGDTTNVYARRLSQTNVVLLARGLFDALRMPESDYRDRRLVALTPGAVTQIDIRSEEPFTLRRLTNGTWLAGETVQADGPFTRDWLTQFSRLQVADFVKDVVTDFSAYGLAPPRRQYIFKTTVTNAGIVTNIVLGELQFGTNTDEKVYVRRADEDSVYAVTMLDYYRMPSAAWQMRDRRVWSFTTNQVASVTMRHDGRSRTLLRSPAGDWKIAPGSQGIINPFAVEEMLFRLGELNATTFLARGKESLAGHGFSSSNLQIVVELKLGEKAQTLTLDFGGPTLAGFPYAATMIDGQVWMFEFPFFLFQDMERAFGLPLVELPRRAEKESGQIPRSGRARSGGWGMGALPIAAIPH